MTTHDLHARDLTLGYTDADVVSHLDLQVPDARITVIVGANASGKSTLLRGLARLLHPRGGEVLLDGTPMRDMRSIDVAKEAVSAALEATGIADLVERGLASLSGGQRQRVWVAMVLAQDTDVLLLDEPTTFLNINHQVELLDLLTDLNRRSGKTIVLVLHDLNLACRYADHIVAVKDGAILAQGAPSDIFDADIVTQVFGLPCVVVPDPISGTPMIVVRGRHQAGRTAAYGVGGTG